MTKPPAIFPGSRRPGRNALLRLTALLALCSASAFASDPSGQSPEATRWRISADGGIAWDVAPGDIHQDFIEMNGERIALVVRYGTNEQGRFTVSHSAIWPMLRLHPNLTFNHLRMSFGEDVRSSPSERTDFGSDARFGLGLAPAIFLRTGDHWLEATDRIVRRIYHKGIARFEGVLGQQLSFRRAIFPATNQPAAIDTTLLTNTSQSDVELSVAEFQREYKTSAERGVYGAYTVTERVLGAGAHKLKPGEEIRVSVIFEAHKKDQPLLDLDVVAEERARMHRVEDILAPLQLQTPDPVLNTAFAFAKLHAAESIFRTKGGLLHSPGGGMAYYAAIWANDQAEYANPFFAMLGDPIATESAINSFRHFARYINPEYRAIPASIIAEGDGIWNGAGDRGDVAMIAYGAARFALANGDRRCAEELWTLIEWSLEYLRRKVTPQGVVASDSDELEGRFPAGKANLNTSSLYYDALLSAAMLGKNLGKPAAQLKDYEARAAAAHAAIERHFGAEVEGFHTYRYYDRAELAGHSRPEFAAYATRPDVLRAWIATPLAMGIFDRKASTIEALFSPRLWIAEGLASEAGQTTYWDRPTLYALRGVLAAGDTKAGMEHLTYYSNRRLLGDHVPYPIEAYPEGGRGQLSAESALYCRVFTEGLFGLRPTGLTTFTLTPRLPEGWPSMALKNVRAFGAVFDLRVTRKGAHQLTIELIGPREHKNSYVIESGATAALNVSPQS